MQPCWQHEQFPVEEGYHELDKMNEWTLKSLHYQAKAGVPIKKGLGFGCRLHWLLFGMYSWCHGNIELLSNIGKCPLQGNETET